MYELSLLVTACLQALCRVHWSSWPATGRLALPCGPLSLHHPLPPTSHCSSFLWRSRAWRDFNRTHIHINNTARRKRKLEKKKEKPTSIVTLFWLLWTLHSVNGGLMPRLCKLFLCVWARLTYHSPCGEWDFRELFQGWWWEMIRASERIFSSDVSTVW